MVPLPLSKTNLQLPFIFYVWPHWKEKKQPSYLPLAQWLLGLWIWCALGDLLLPENNHEAFLVKRTLLLLLQYSSHFVENWRWKLRIFICHTFSCRPKNSLQTDNQMEGWKIVCQKVCVCAGREGGGEKGILCSEANIENNQDNDKHSKT